MTSATGIPRTNDWAGRETLGTSALCNARQPHLTTHCRHNSQEVS